LGERGVMEVGRGDQKEDGQARVTTEQGMHAIPAQERAGMLGRGMTQGRIGVGSEPSQDGGTVDDQIVRSNESRADGREH